MQKIIVLLAIAIIALVAFKTPTQFVVTGKITDKTKQPVAGVAVMVKNTKTATVSAADGSYSITVPDEKASLVFSAVGFVTKQVKVGSKKIINVQLSYTTNELQEVVVTGYSSSDLIAVDSYDRTIAMKPVYKANLNGALQGKAAGIQVITAQPGLKKDKYTNNIADREGYDFIKENAFVKATENPLSTFSIDVDAASYSNVRRLLQQGSLPPAGAVRIEEMVNYFKYDYPQPEGDQPFTVNTEMGDCPWNPDHRLALIGLQGKNIPVTNLPASNLVFLIDVSGSMESPDKLPLVQQSMKLLTDQLREQDNVAIVVYAGNAGLVLPSTSGANKTTIKNAIDALQAGGSTAGGEGIQLAYKTALAHFKNKGNNRVILCTDGDFNVGASSDDELERLIEKQRESGVFLTIMGFGTGNYQDAKMQKLADKGNGNHAYIDNLSEAKKVLVAEFGGTLFTIAKDVKLQVEFNPALVQGYRLIGYENRMLNKEDFNDDTKDAGELGSGHTVTALYEIIPVGKVSPFLKSVDKLKYQAEAEFPKAVFNSEWMTVKLRYKQPAGNTSQLLEQAVNYAGKSKLHTSDNYRFAAAVASFGMLLRNSEFKQHASYTGVLQLANTAVGKDAEGYRKEFIKLVKTAADIAGANVPDEEDDLSKQEFPLKQ
ncbi:von Willebrand factor type A domain-containing protein [Ferruginibacter paludis]|uniref:vWA domain-containing protein n=1 Tax=Ferruginibacter paludis TaxID=1310417 RepID=UPI0025B4A756|nr:von Willebrand factor type A domain-containing protein [Ferruginibacter paludis]MDN3659185.1 von Willebrand factor type A domain-containing protein [Ferruginibacter paludis]